MTVAWRTQKWLYPARLRGWQRPPERRWQPHPNGCDEKTLARPFCYRCHKPAVTCICARVKRVDNRTKIWLLQHPRERFHPIGTARIARLGLGRFEQTMA
ncbi:MAG TPA: DTW domain-containing protein, partial [Sorangium sp.]|nr:DTW domain-containing protein [Sorangium sp.]